MVFEVGEKVHIVERRYFSDDLRRHFVGEIVRCSDYVIRVVGYTWVFDSIKGAFVKKKEKRERVFPLGERLTMNIIPVKTNVDEVKYVSEAGGLVVTDGKFFSFEITEFSARR